MDPGEIKKQYFNKKQLEAMSIAAHDEYIVASRGFGKSEGIDAPRLLRNVFAMPRSAGAMLSPTYGKLLQNTLPAIAHALERWGYYRNVHYYVGRKPPLSANFEKPLINPFKYDNVMSWFNGSILHLTSFDRPMSVNSMSLDYILGFESKYLDYEKIKNEVLPANRGNNNIYKNCPWHHGQVYTTDMPTNSRGSWIFDKEKEMVPKLIKHLKILYNLYSYYKLKNDNYKAVKLLRDLNLLRSKATFYAEYSAFDNIELLGEDFIRNMKRDLPPLIFLTSIANQRIYKVPNGFYASFDDNIHTYPNILKLKSEIDLSIWDLSNSETFLYDSDLIDDMPLEIAADYNASICNLVVGQLNGNRIRTVNKFHVTTPKKLREVTEDFCRYYRHRSKKEVIYYYDSTAVCETASSSQTFADEIIDILSNHNFIVEPVYIGQPEKHHIKHNQMDRAFKGDPDFLTPEFNEEKCEDLILSMQQTGIKKGRNGFEKDKDNEKRADTPENPDKLKTHVTDAWDTLFQGMNFYRPNLNSVFGASSFWG